MFDEALILGLPTVAALPEDVRVKIVAETVALGKNAATAFEAELVARKKLEWATRDEEDILKLTGIPKGVKTDGKPEAYYDYRNRVITDYKTKAESGADKTELDNLKRDLEAAKKALKDNTGDATLRVEVEQAKQSVADKEAQVSAFKKQLADVEANAKKLVADEKNNLNKYRALMEFQTAKSGFKFQDESVMPKEVRDTFANSAYEKIMATRPHEFRKGTDGNESLVFLKPDGTIDYNPDKGLAPFTLADYLEKELAPILDKGHQQAGAGTKSGAGGGGTIIVDLGFAKSKTQVDEIINADLMKRGISKSHADYNKLYQEAKATVKNFAELPFVAR